MPRDRLAPSLTLRAWCCAAFAVIGCGVDFQADQAGYDKLLCLQDAAACPNQGGAAGLGATGGIAGTDASVGGTGGVSGSGGVAGTDGGPCTIGETRCTGKSSELCVGGVWQATPCTLPTPECELGQCVVCINGASRCENAVPQSCVSNSWLSQAACSGGAICQDGGCVVPPSCIALAANCGLGGNESCCQTTSVPGGSFARDNNAAYPASVSTYLLDKYEVTVGRFRKFVTIYPFTPAADAGKNPNVPGSGWSSTFDAMLPLTQAILMSSLNCNSFSTWTDTPGANENQPINCLDWYTALAFCAWDGGRLPTDLEWNYAAAGGNEQRLYPWGNTAPAANALLAVYGCYYKAGASCALDDIAPVGSVLAGNGKWGQADLAGNVEEWALDFSGPYPASCIDCANIATGSLRVLRGGAFNGVASSLLTSASNALTPAVKSSTAGVRCARTP